MTQADYISKPLGADETVETVIGEVTIPATGVSKIVGLVGIITIKTTTAGKGTAGYIRLAFKTVAGTYKFAAQIFQGAFGTTGGIGPAQDPKIIPVDISVPANEVITIYAALDTAQTGSCVASVNLIYG